MIDRPTNNIYYILDLENTNLSSRSWKAAEKFTYPQSALTDGRTFRVIEKLHYWKVYDWRATDRPLLRGKLYLTLEKKGMLDKQFYICIRLIRFC